MEGWKGELLEFYKSRLEILTSPKIGEVDSAPVFDPNILEKVNHPIVVVGEAPGEQEAKKGVPFIGKAGKNLDYLLQLAGIDRKREVVITNIFPFRPIILEEKGEVKRSRQKDKIGDGRGRVEYPSNRLEKKIKNRPPTARELKIGVNYLVRELEIIKPTIVLLLGNSSIKGMAYIYPQLKKFPKCGFYRLEGIWWGICYHPSPLAFNRLKIRQALEDFFKRLPIQLKAIDSKVTFSRNSHPLFTASIPSIFSQSNQPVSRTLISDSLFLERRDRFKKGKDRSEHNSQLDTSTQGKESGGKSNRE